MKKFLFTIFLTGFFLVSINTVFGAELYFSAPDSVRLGGTFEVSVLFNTEGESINAADIEINFDQKLLSFAGYKETEGVLGFWIERPRLENGRIHLAGVIPGGVTGSYNPNKKGQQPVSLAKITFIAKSLGTANLSFFKSQVLKNDGLGTELSHTKMKDFVVVYSKTEEPLEKPTVEPTNLPTDAPKVSKDTENPTTLTLDYFESNLFLRIPSIISFYAYDADSGIERYEIKIENKDWQRAESPYSIGESLFKRQIVLRAYDYAGNYKDASIIVPGSITLWILIVFVLLVLFLLATYEFLLIYHRRKRKQNQ